MSDFFVYAIGAALVDTEIAVTDADLDHLGVEKGMMTLVDEDRQTEIKTFLSDRLAAATHACGGSAGNSMIAASQFGAPSYMSCLVADDADGDIYVRDLEQCGVAHGFANGRRAGTTGKCIVLISPDAERSMNTFLGISEQISITEVNETAIANSEWVYLEGYLVTSPTGQEAALETKRVAQAKSTKVAVSFSDPGMVTFFRDNLDAIIGDGVDFIFCNEIEALEWAGTDNLDAAAEAMRTIANEFVITLGAEGCLVFDGEKVHRLAAKAVDAINTNGAGDMFAGAYFYSLWRGESTLTACAFASEASAAVVCEHGPRLTQEQSTVLRDEFFVN